MALALDRSRPFGAIVVGRAGLDLYPLPDGTKTELAEEFAAELGGSAGNIAVALTRQGCRAALLGPLSDDPVGRFVRARLNRYAVDTTRCRAIMGEHRTSLAVAETRIEHCEVVIYRNGAADLQLKRDDVDQGFIQSAATLIVTGTALAAEPSRAATMEALAYARAMKTFSILDVDYRHYSWKSREEAQQVLFRAASQCDAVVGNDEEFSVLAGNQSSALAAASGCVETGRKFAILKQGTSGSLTVTEEGTFHTDIFAVQAKKPFGSGDAFLGSLVASLLRGLSLREAVVRASAAAAFVVSRRGCASVMPTAQELETFLLNLPQ